MNEAQRCKAWVNDMIELHPHWTPRERERAYFLMPSRIAVASNRLTQENYARRMSIYLAYVTVPNQPPFPKGTGWNEDNTLRIGTRGY